MWLVSEVLFGIWEVLLDCWVDLLVGVVGEGLSGGGYVVELMGVVCFVFVVVFLYLLVIVFELFGWEVLVVYCVIVVVDLVCWLLLCMVGLLMG